MSIDYSVHQKCKPKVHHGSGSMERGSAVILNTLKAIATFERLETEAEEKGIYYQDIRVPFRAVTASGVETVQLAPEDVNLRRYQLDDKAEHCAECPANFLGTPYGCYGTFRFPVTDQCEKWLVERVVSAGPVGTELFEEAVTRLRWSGAWVGEMRARAGEFFQLTRAPAIRIGMVPRGFTTDVVWHALLDVGRLAPSHCLGVLVWLRAIRVNGRVLDDRAQLRELLQCTSANRRAALAELDLEGVAGLDRQDTSGLGALLTAAYVAWLNDVPLAVER